MKNRMKAGRLAVLFGAFGLTCAMTGCAESGEKAESRKEEVIRIEASTDENAAQNESGQAQTVPETASGENIDNMPDSEQDENELEGDVRSVGEGSMVVSKIFNYAEDGNQIAVSYAEDGPDAVLISVYFSEDTEYIVRTVKNGGVNGDSDVEDRAGALTDIREGNTVLMNGSYEGEDFHAVQVIIYNFI